MRKQIKIKERVPGKMAYHSIGRPEEHGRKQKRKIN